MININNVSKLYKLSRKQSKEMGPDFTGNSILAVDNISLNCKPGRIFGLIGPNGAGKTTTLRMIGTMLKPSSGTISVNNFDTVSQAYFVKHTLGFLYNIFWVISPIFAPKSTTMSPSFTLKYLK